MWMVICKSRTNHSNGGDELWIHYSYYCFCGNLIGCVYHRGAVPFHKNLAKSPWWHPVQFPREQMCFIFLLQTLLCSIFFGPSSLAQVWKFIPSVSTSLLGDGASHLAGVSCGPFIGFTWVHQWSHEVSTMISSWQRVDCVIIRALSIINMLVANIRDELSADQVDQPLEKRWETHGTLQWLIGITCFSWFYHYLATVIFIPTIL